MAVSIPWGPKTYRHGADRTSRGQIKVDATQKLWFKGLADTAFGGGWDVMFDASTGAVASGTSGIDIYPYRNDPADPRYNDHYDSIIGVLTTAGGTGTVHKAGTPRITMSVQWTADDSPTTRP
jgi:hypothetical protein